MFIEILYFFFFWLIYVHTFIVIICLSFGCTLSLLFFDFHLCAHIHCNFWLFRCNYLTHLFAHFHCNFDSCVHMFIVHSCAHVNCNFWLICVHIFIVIFWLSYVCTHSLYFCLICVLTFIVIFWLSLIFLCTLSLYFFTAIYVHAFIVIFVCHLCAHPYCIFWLSFVCTPSLYFWLIRVHTFNVIFDTILWTLSRLFVSVICVHTSL